jgi:hypothetical protein
MVELSPTLEQWRRLYELADQINRLAPWKWMVETDLFGVQIPRTGEIGFVSIMGMAGEHFAVAVYPDARSLRAFLALQDSQSEQPEDHADRLLEILQFQLSFESRDLVEKQDRQIIDELGLRFRGAHAWPLFRSYQPGFLPWSIDGAEADSLLSTLEQTLQVAPRCRQNPQLLHPDQEDVYLTRVETATGWEDQYRRVLSPPLPEPPARSLDPFVLNRFRQLPRTPHPLELDLFRLWSPVKESHTRPFFPYVLLLVEPAGGTVAGFEMLTPLPSLQEMWDTVPLRVMQAFEQQGGLPVRVQVSSPRLAAVLDATARALGLQVEQVPSLPHLDRAKTHLAQAARSGFDPALVPVDFGPGRASNPVDTDQADEGAANEPEPELDDGDQTPFGSPSSDLLDSLAAALVEMGRQGPLPTSQIDFRSILAGRDVDARGPGTVLRDFAQLLEAIGPEGIEVTRTAKLPQGRFMARINERLVQPLRLSLQRPLPRSYPNVSGLYLLLRATGLGRIRTGRRLIVDPAVLEQWRRLNSTEQYFTLLESWLLDGRPEILGEIPGQFDIPLRQWIEFHLAIPGTGLQLAGNPDSLLRTNAPGLPNLALMESFGLLTICHSPPEPGQGWRIERVARTGWGDALLARLFDYLTGEWKRDDQPPPEPFGRLQPVYQPLFPQWRAHLVVPTASPIDGQFVFTVTLEQAWRRIAVPAECLLEHLAGAILEAFEFDEDHLYSFIFANRFGRTIRVNHPFMQDPPSADQVRVGDLRLEPGDTMTFLYDFGDHWEFAVALERTEPADRRGYTPRLLESRGQAPRQYPD